MKLVVIWENQNVHILAKFVTAKENLLMVIIGNLLKQNAHSIGHIWISSSEAEQQSVKLQGEIS